MPIGSPISLVVTFLALAGIAWAGWRIYGDDDFRIFNTFRAAMIGAPEEAMKGGVANSSRAIAPEDRRRQIEAAIFLIPFITYAYFYQGADQSIACRFDLLRSMIEKGALYINDFCGFNTADIITFHGHIYSVKAPGTSYTALIPWMIFQIALLPMKAAHEPLYWAFVTYLTTVFTTGLLISAMCVVMFRFARFLGASDGPRGRRRADSRPRDDRISVRD